MSRVVHALMSTLRRRRGTPRGTGHDRAFPISREVLAAAATFAAGVAMTTSMAIYHVNRASPTTPAAQCGVAGIHVGQLSPGNTQEGASTCIRLRDQLAAVKEKPIWYGIPDTDEPRFEILTREQDLIKKMSLPQVMALVPWFSEKYQEKVFEFLVGLKLRND